MAITVWDGALILEFNHKMKAPVSHLLTQGNTISITHILISIETISLLIKPIVPAINLAANISVVYLLIHLMEGYTSSHKH